MPHSLTSLPVRGALQVEAMEPTATQAVRESRSIHFQDAARATTTALSRTSTRVSGYIWRSWIAKLVICASGKARPMQSASTTGRPSMAAAMKGWSELPPPISRDMTARNDRPITSSIIRTAWAMVCGSVRRSCPTSGAPMLETTATRSSSPSSMGSRRGTTGPFRSRWRRLRRARYGLPPPPVPRIQATMAIDSISSRLTGRAGIGLEPGKLFEAHEPRDAEHEDENHPDGEGGHCGRRGIERVLEIGEKLDGEWGERGAGEKERQGEVVEGDGEGEDGARDHPGLDDAQGDLEEGAQRRGAQALRRLLERAVEVVERGGGGADHVGRRYHKMAEEERPV